MILEEIGVSETVFSPKERELNYRFNISESPGFVSAGVGAPKEIAVKRQSRSSNKYIVQQYLRRNNFKILQRYRGDIRFLKNPYAVPGLHNAQFI